MLSGFDASGWSGTVNCTAAKAAGKRFAFFRAGRGKPDGATDSTGIDLAWGINKGNAVNVNLPVGGYWRFFPDVSMTQQVDRFVRVLGQKPGMLAPLLDMEDSAGLGKTALTDWTLQCAALIKQKTGRSPIIYTGKYFYDNNLEYWRLDQYQLALAATRTSWVDYAAIFHQYKLDTPSSFSSGNVDLQSFALDSLQHHLYEHQLRYFFDEIGMLHGPMCYDKRLPESGSSGTQTNAIAIKHTMVGYLRGTDSWFRRADVSVESHTGIGGKYDPVELDGAIWQWMRATERANANVAGDAYGFSTETSDGGGNRYLERWSPKQAESIAQESAAWCLKYDRPARLVARARSTERGLGYHRMGIDPWRLAGDDKWTLSPGKLCPGDTRIAQFRNETVPRINQILSSLSGLPVEPPEEDGDMQLDEIVGTKPDGSTFTVRDVLAANYLSTLPEEVCRKLEDLPVEIQQLVKSSVNQLSDLLYMLHGQAKWQELESVTWESLSNKPWAMLK